MGDESLKKAYDRAMADKRRLARNNAFLIKVLIGILVDVQFLYHKVS